MSGATAHGEIRSTAARTDLQAMAVGGIQKALLQVPPPGALLGRHLLTLLHHRPQGLLLYLQGLLQLCSPVPLLVHLALEALVLILSLLCSSHQSVHAHTLSKRCGPCASPCQPG